jgi:hypothetical protein
LYNQKKRKAAQKRRFVCLPFTKEKAMTGKNIMIYVPAALTSNGNGLIKKPFIWQLGDQCGELINRNNGVLMVVSGSIACCPREDLTPGLRSAIGNHLFVDLFKECLEKSHGIIVAPLVYNREDFKRPDVLAVIREALAHRIFVHVNARDYVSDEEVVAMEHGIDNFFLFQQIAMQLKPSLSIVAWDFSAPAESFGIIRNGINEMNDKKINTVIWDGTARGFLLNAFNIL